MNDILDNLKFIFLGDVEAMIRIARRHLEELKKLPKSGERDNYIAEQEVYIRIAKDCKTSAELIEKTEKLWEGE